MLHHKLLHTPLDLWMAHDERTKCRRNIQRPKLLSRCRVARTGYIQELETVREGRSTHERRTLFTRLSMGKNAILVRTLAKVRMNEVAPDTGDDTFSYSSASCYQIEFQFQFQQISNIPTEARTYSTGSDSQSS